MQALFTCSTSDMCMIIADTYTNIFYTLAVPSGGVSRTIERYQRSSNAVIARVALASNFVDLPRE